MILLKIQGNSRDRKSQLAVKAKLCFLYEVLRQKEIELVRLRKEVHALKLIIPLVQDDETWQADSVMEAKAALRKIFHNPDANELTAEP